MTDLPMFDYPVWVQKARAFVTRSHRHLWGRNNEDPQAFLFTKGLKNTFIKQQMIGWNKFAQERPAKNWGDKTSEKSDKKLFLPSGIVIPYIKDKQLLSVFIHSFDEKENITLLPGSRRSTIILGENKNQIIMTRNLFKGLLFFQDQVQPACIMIYPDKSIPLDDASKALLEKTAQILDTESL